MRNSVKRKPDAGLTLIGMRRHAGLGFERTIEPVGRQVRGIRDVGKADTLVEMGIQIFPRETDGAAFAADGARISRIDDVAVEQPPREPQVAFVALKPGSAGFRQRMKGRERTDKRAIPDDRPADRAATGL